MKTQFRKLGIVSVLAFSIFSCEKDAEHTVIDDNGLTDPTNTVVGPEHAISGSYIIVFNADKSLNGNKAAIQNKSAKIMKKYGIKSENQEFTYANAVQGFSVKNVSVKKAELLKNDPDIAYIEPNYVTKLDYKILDSSNQLPVTEEQSKAVTNGGYLSSGDYEPWGIKRVGRSNGQGKTSWIIDSGIAPHNDLDIDTNRSRSFVRGENSWSDLNGHGTHVAGTVAAKMNGRGVVGVAHGATVVAIKVLGARGTGSNSGILAGVDYVMRNARSGDTWNYSIGTRSRHISRTTDDAFRKLERQAYGAMAAGNSNDDTQYYSPQNLQTSRTWVVGNMTNRDRSNSGSSYGQSVDCWAPGTGVWSTWINGGYKKISGTSMASPHVAGILLLRGNSIGRDGSVSKGGYTAPIATK
ncbi:S8 family serine peptidase [Aquimarina sp. TRL1]|uniref:S8 family serine peptidase n=1 Tax=Aquimarina sp. (strain TRL1) TaxID=2736252 RepID=UPI00158CB03B|nr:S8 family serine peptidase [Aquimarina sp. TRL1]QKX06569.1 S8 family serine peptidase [Aquimarina sp. TRL1]